MAQKIDYNINEMILYVKEEETVLDSIFELYSPLIYSQINNYKNIIAYLKIDINDIVQEANLALTKAINKYDSTQDIKFITFATVIIKRTMINYFKRCGYAKKEISFDTFNNDVYLDYNKNVFDRILKNESDNPLHIILENEDSQLLLNKLDNLTEKEKQIVFYLLNDLSVKDIAKKLNKSNGQIYYSIKKIKKALKINKN